MGGSIGFSTRPGPGSGTVFHFEIPFRIAAGDAMPEAPIPQAKDVPAGPGPGSQARLLIVEDHPLNQKVLSGFLSQAGYRADVASSGQEALTVFARSPYDMVFMDCHMPGMDGYECTRALRKMRIGGTRPAIIGVTADAMVGIREKCLRAGMDEVLTKPLLTEELRGVLSRWLGMAKPGRSVPAQVSPLRMGGHAPSPRDG